MQNFNNNNNITIADLKINNVYTTNDIVEAFKCAPQGGMRRSHATNTLVIFVLHNEPLYEDSWNGDILNYTGMGQVGNQSVDFAQNKTLSESNQNGITVHLFESYVDKEYKYDGIVKLAGDIYFDDEPDVNGDMRKVVKFPLKRVDTTPLSVSTQDIEASNKQKEKEIKKYPDRKLKELAKKSGNKKPKKQNATTTVIERNQAVVEYTKRRARGICDLCDMNAPFNDKDGKQYLECHHVIMLSKGGPDAYYNTVALCPNCHRKMHILKRSKDLAKLKSKIKKYLENDNDIDSLNEYKLLFKDN